MKDNGRCVQKTSQTCGKKTRAWTKTRPLRVDGAGARLVLIPVANGTETPMSNPHPVIPVEHQFKPGNPGGPGRPRKRVLSDRYEALLESRLPPEIAIAMKLPVGALWADAVATAAARLALKSTEAGVAQRKELREAIEGKAVARVEFSSDETIDIHVSFEDTRKLLNAHTPVIDVESESTGSSTKELPDP